MYIILIYICPISSFFIDICRISSIELLVGRNAICRDARHFTYICIICIYLYLGIVVKTIPFVLKLVSYSNDVSSIYHWIVRSQEFGLATS
jgi:hypothetical protein